MSDFSDPDVKIRRLIELCLQTKNYKKISAASLVLNHNIVLKIGLNLGIRPVQKTSNDNISRHMTLINVIYNQRFGTFLFPKVHIETLMKIEKQFFEKKGELSIDLIKKAFLIYYDLKELDMPREHESFNSYEAPLPKFKLFPKSSEGQDYKTDGIYQFVLQEINKEETLLRNQIGAPRSPKGVPLKAPNKSRIENFMEYQSKSGSFILYAFLIISIIFYSFGAIVLIETVYFPSLASVLSPLLLIFFSFGLLSTIAFNYYRRGV